MAPMRGRGNNLKIAALAALSLLICAVVVILSCSPQSKPSSFDIASITSYRDIPGVTAEEIAAIEALREKTESFVFGMELSTEAFVNSSGEIRGYSALLCEWLTQIFGIPFVIPELVTWNGLLEGLSNGSIHFTGELTATEERKNPTDPAKKPYFMTTDAIAQRLIVYLRLAGSAPLSEIAKERLPRFALLDGTTTIKDVSIYAIDKFESVFVDEYIDAYELMKNGVIDALIAENAAEAVFDDTGDVVVQEFFPVIYSPVSLTTKIAELKPIISVMQKALEHGAYRHLNRLYNRGYREYLRHKLYMRFTDEERLFVENNPVILFGAEYDNYPISFYNTRLKEWQGVCFDVLREAGQLVGLEFRPANAPDAEWPDLLSALENGEVPMVTELVRTAERESRFLWSDNSLWRDYSMLISKSKFPNVNAGEIYNVRVGLGRGTAHTEFFRKMFPNHKKAVEYDGLGVALEALKRGEVDMVMHRGIGLLRLINYDELPGYKANLLFDNYFDSRFGFSKDAEILRSIVDKTLEMIDIGRIRQDWSTRSYDYLRVMAQERARYMTIFTVIVSIAFIGLIFLIINDRKKSKTILDTELASRAKSQFLAVMSHEIRTPMNSIMGFAELALDAAVVPQVVDYLEKIKGSTKWLLNIVNDVLDISKIESGKMELENAPFDLSDVISRCHSVILPLAQEKGLDMRVCCEPPANKKLAGDQIRLHQALVNLLSNAVKFTDAGTVELTALVKGLDENRASVYFEVRDTGIGMNAEQVKKIFEPFIQVDSSATRKYEGTGLGLAIVKNIVELMGGKLTVESEPGKGTAFSFQLSFETMDVYEDAAENTKSGAVEKPLFDGLVLICDDNFMNQQVMSGHLASVGLKTVVVNNGKEGVERVAQRARNGEKPFDLILMDIFMPVMGGVEAASKIAALNTGTPVVAVTANIMPSELDKYKKSGMSDCLGKPFTSQELWRVLLKYLTLTGSSVVNGTDARTHDELQKKLRVNFIKSNQTIYAEIIEAIEAGDARLGHRLSHTLKGNAAIIGKTKLQAAASALEDLFKEAAVSQLCAPQSQALSECMKILKSELEPVLEELRPLLDEEFAKSKKTLSFEQALAVFEKLEPLLEDLNSECMNLLDDVRSIAGAEELVRQIEDYEFELAAQTLAGLKKKWV